MAERGRRVQVEEVDQQRVEVGVDMVLHEKEEKDKIERGVNELLRDWER